jgi:hypothetical protein
MYSKEEMKLKDLEKLEKGIQSIMNELVMELERIDDRETRTKARSLVFDICKNSQRMIREQKERLKEGEIYR